jgi:hypothetical protein
MVPVRTPAAWATPHPGELAAEPPQTLLTQESLPLQSRSSEPYGSHRSCPRR